MSVIDFRINNRRLKEVCEELGIRVPYIIVDDDPPTGHENRGATAFPDGVIKLYRRRFELAHRGALAKASNQPLVTPAALLGTCADKARHVLLHELYHCKQYGGRPRRRSRTSGSRGLCRRKRTSLGRPSEAGGQVAARVSNYRVVFIPEQNRRA